MSETPPTPTRPIEVVIVLLFVAILAVGLAAIVAAVSPHPMACSATVQDPMAVRGSVASAAGVTVTPVSYSYAEHMAHLRIQVATSRTVDYARLACRFERDGKLVQTNATAIVDRRSGDDTQESLDTWVSDEPDHWSCTVDSVK